jgi:quercetin dioxygenase-like cupin family protein
MIDDGLLDELAGEYVLGTLDGEARNRFESRLSSDGDAQQAVAQWEARLSSLVEREAELQPSDEVWAAIKARLEDEPFPGIVTVREEEGVWAEHATGIAIKTLHVDRETGVTSLLMRMEPGSRYPAHKHTGDEECLMLAGEVSFGDLTLRAGDYHLAPKGMDHAEAYSATGALVFIRSHAA